MKSADLKEHNSSRLIQCVAHAPGQLSRADLARRVGLTRATVSSLVEELIAGRLLVEIEPLSGAMGRPKTPLSLAEHTLIAIGVEVRAHSVRLLVRDLSGNHVIRLTEDYMPRYGTIDGTVTAIAELVSRGIVQATREWEETGDLPVVEVCVSVPGRVSTDGLSVLSAPNLGWESVDLIGRLRNHPLMRSLTVVARNDNHLSVLDEIESRPGETFLYVRGRTGIGGALVFGGELVDGEHGWSGELGHTIVDLGGRRCKCGRQGCLEAYISPDRIKELAGVGMDQPTEELVRDIAATRPEMLVDNVAPPLGLALANALNVLDVSKVVLGGYLGCMGEETNMAVREIVEAGALVVDAEPIEIVAESSVEGRALRGAGKAAIEPVLANPLNWMQS